MSEQEPATPDWNRLFWSASQLFMLGLVSRFYRNYERFGTSGSEKKVPADAASLLELTRTILYKQRTYLNLLAKEADSIRPSDRISALLLHRQIADYLDDLHIRLLEHDPDRIVPLIPGIDRQRKQWRWNPDDDPFGELSYDYQLSYTSLLRWKEELARQL